MDRAFRGMWIPAEIRLTTDLSLVEKCLLVEIDSLDITDQHCFAENSHFAELLQCSIPTITRGIAKLKDLWYIEEKSFDWKKRTLVSLIKMIRQTNQNDEAASSKWLGSIYMNNNTNNNTNNSKEKIKKEIEEKKLESFNKFYSSYLRKENKKGAFKAWMKLSQEQEILAIEWVEKMKKYNPRWQWDWQFIPHPATYLNWERWNDQVDTSRVLSQEQETVKPEKIAWYLRDWKTYVEISWEKKKRYGVYYFDESRWMWRVIPWFN